MGNVRSYIFVVLPVPVTKCLDILASAAFVLTIPPLTCLLEVPQL